MHTVIRFLPAFLLLAICRADAQDAIWPIHAAEYNAEAFQPRKTLANYYGLPTPDGGAATPALFENLSARELADLLAFANFPEKSRRSRLTTTLERRASDLDKLAREEAAGKSLAAYVGLTLADGTLITAAMLDELSPQARSFALAFAGFPAESRERIIRNAFKSLGDEKARLKDQEREAEKYDREQAERLAADKQREEERIRKDEERKRERERAEAERARKLAEQEAQRKERAEEQATRDLEATLERAEEDERRNQEAALAAIEREENRLRLEQEAERLQREHEAERLAFSNHADNKPQVAHNNVPPHPAFRTKIDRHAPPMNMDQFRREHMQPAANDGGRFRLSGRAIKGLITLGVLMIGGVFAGLRMLFRGSAAE